MSIRSKNKTSAAIASQGKHSVVVKRSNNHFDAQILSPAGTALGGASTKSAAIHKKIGKQTGNCQAATKLGEIIAAQLKKMDITDIAFNRSGYIYHGRIAAFVDGMRKAGVKV